VARRRQTEDGRTSGGVAMNSVKHRAMSTMSMEPSRLLENPPV
jgi:hypothetical protein